MRILDKSKLERIKTEVKKLIVEKGYHRASISELAKRAKVSDGYLYRHYKNKFELVFDVLETSLKKYHDYIFDLLDTKQTALEITEGIIDYLFNLSVTDPYSLGFTHTLVYEFDFEYPKTRKDAINKLSSDIVELGIKTGEFAKDTRSIDVMTTILTIPVKYIEYSDRGYYKMPKNVEKDKIKIAKMCMNSLK